MQKPSGSADQIRETSLSAQEIVALIERYLAQAIASSREASIGVSLANTTEQRELARNQLALITGQKLVLQGVLADIYGISISEQFLKEKI
jgi:hypothetical protein